jgi:flagellar basal-body rod modification protein FlgD
LRHDIGSASSLIGKEVTWNEYDSNGAIVQKSGVVDSIISSDGLLYVEVNGSRVGIDYITGISAKTEENNTTSSNDTNEEVNG